MSFFTKKVGICVTPCPLIRPLVFDADVIYCTKIFVIRHCILTELHVKISDSVLSIPAREPVIWN